MNNLIYKNAYGILGLLPNSTQKDILRRIKEIEKMIQIDEIPEYSYDFLHYSNLRNLQNVKEASLQISAAKTQYLHYFFRIYLNTEKDLEDFKNLDVKFSLDKIQTYREEHPQNSLINKKNTAILLTLFLLTNKIDSADVVAQSCLLEWKDLLTNSKTLSDFKKIFLLDDEIGLDESLFENIEDDIKNELVKIFSDISQFQNNNELFANFIEEFELQNTTIDVEQVEKIYRSIDNSLKELKAMHISADGIFDDDEKATLKRCLSNFQDCFNELIELGLYDNEKTIILRDEVATHIRLHCIDLVNNLEEEKTALKMVDFSIGVAGTKSLREKLKEDKDIIKENEKFRDISKLVDNFIKKLDKIKNNKTSITESQITVIVVNILTEADKFFNQHNDEQLKSIFFERLAGELFELALDLNNNYSKYKEALILITYAKSFAKNNALKSACLKNYGPIKANAEAFARYKANKTDGTTNGCSWLIGIIIFIIWVCVLYPIFSN